ncbi:MAG: hypothetical protein AAF438_24040, partial [Pseudomonadota bacterium]
LVLLCLSCFATAGDYNKKFPRKTTSITTYAPVIEIVNAGGLDSSLGEQIDATTVLHRSRNGLAMTFNTKNLAMEAPYTTWWVVFNGPEKCLNPCECGFADVFDPVYADAAKTAVFWASGRMTDDFGQAVFMAQTKRGELPVGEDQVVFGDGLTSRRAEVHLVTRGQGPIDPLNLEAQLTQFNGGCEVAPENCFDTHVSVHRSPFCKVRRGKDRWWKDSDSD